MLRGIYLLSVIFLASFGLSPDARAENKIDNDFVHAASISGVFEIDSSKLAQTNAQSELVKGFAATMIEDHTLASGNLKEAAAKTEAAQAITHLLDEAHSQKIEELRSLQGEAFDHRYISMQTEAHAQSINLFRNYLTHGKNTPLRAFAQETLPKFEMHANSINMMAHTAD